MGTTPFTPAEFLEHLKKAEARTFSGPPVSQEFTDLHANDLEKFGIGGLNPEKWFDDYFNALFRLLVSPLPAPAQASLLDQVAVGCVDNLEVNACIVRSSRGSCYAILINRALLTMLNHCVKLISAANHPSAVLHFGGLPIDASAAGSQYSKACTAMLKAYGETGKPLGPELKLAVDTPAMGFVSEALVASHAFVLAHEVGHYVNGDLDSAANFFARDNVPGGTVFGGKNVSHVMEFGADRFAFEAVLRMLCARGATNLPARRALDLSVTLFFNFLREISNRGSESHPRPSDRILAVTHEFFGDEAAGLMERSFNDVSVISTFRDHVGDTTVSELLAERSQAVRTGEPTARRRVKGVDY